MELTGYLPERHRAFETWAFEEAIQPLFDARELAHDDFVAQLSLATATWGLSAWEAALGIPTDESKSYDARRTRVIAKLRGRGTTTVSVIEIVAAGFSKGAVSVVEHNGESYFEVKFLGNIGIPPSYDDLRTAIEEIKPAHLGVLYVMRFRTWRMAGEKKWKDWAGGTWRQMKGEIP